MLRIICILLLLQCTVSHTKATTYLDVNYPRDTILPMVFVIGDYEPVYDQLLSEYHTLLLSACDDDMTIAFGHWKSMLLDMEAYSETVDYDLKGIKLWVNVFWNADGTIRHIAYYLKPLSRHIDQYDLKSFLESFIRQYQFPLKYQEQFSHYGTAAFPLLPKLYLRKQ